MFGYPKNESIGGAEYKTPYDDLDGVDLTFVQPYYKRSLRESIPTPEESPKSSDAKVRFTIETLGTFEAPLAELVNCGDGHRVYIKKVSD